MLSALRLNWGQIALTTALAFVSFVLLVSAAHADSVNTQILTSASSRVQAVYTQTATIVWYIGAFGIIVLAVLAFFGRFPWTRFFALAGGLFLIAFIQQLIQFLGGSGF